MKPTEAYSNISSAELVQTEHSEVSKQPSSSACSAQQQVTTASPHPSAELTTLLDEKSVTPLPSSSTQTSQESISLGGGPEIGLSSFSEKELQALDKLKQLQQKEPLQVQQIQICLVQLNFSMLEILNFMPKYLALTKQFSSSVKRKFSSEDDTCSHQVSNKLSRDSGEQASSSVCLSQQQVMAASAAFGANNPKSSDEKPVIPLSIPSTSASKVSIALASSTVDDSPIFLKKELQALEALKHLQQVGPLQIQQVQICLSQLKFSMPEILSFLPKYTKYIKHQAPLITSALTKLSLINTTTPKGDDSSAKIDRKTEYDKQSEILISVFLPQMTSLFSAFKFTQPQLLVLLDIVLGRKPVASLNEIDTCKKPLAEIALFHLYSIGRIYSAYVKIKKQDK